MRGGNTFESTGVLEKLLFGVAESSGIMKVGHLPELEAA